MNRTKWMLPITAVFLFTASTANAERDELGMLLGLTAQYFLHDVENSFVGFDRPPRRDRQYGNYDDRRSRSYRPQRRERDRDFARHSYTSPPLRGGSSRRTRIIENPYAGRLVTGITLTGLDNRIVHIKDVVSYPGRYLLSPLGYSLSRRHPERFIRAGNYIEYISVAAKRKEYFTVTFHYD